MPLAVGWDQLEDQGLRTDRPHEESRPSVGVHLQQLLACHDDVVAQIHVSAPGIAALWKQAPLQHWLVALQANDLVYIINYTLCQACHAAPPAEVVYHFKGMFKRETAGARVRVLVKTCAAV